MVAAERRARGRHVVLTRAAQRVIERFLREAQPHLLVVNLEDVAAIVLVRIRNVKLEFEAARPQQGGVERFDEVSRAHDEDEFVLMEAVHLGEELVDHGVFDAAAAVVGAAGGGEGIEFVEHDDGGCRLPGFVKGLAQVLFALADPLRFQFRTRDDGDGGPDARGDGLREVRLPGTRRPPEDHAARDQLFEPEHLVGIGGLVPATEHVEDFGFEPLLHFGVTADIAVEIDGGNFHAAGERGLSNLRIRPLRVGGVIFAFEGTEELAEPHGVHTRDVLVQLPGVELAAELAALFLRD